MKRLALIILPAAPTIDILSDPHGRRLMDTPLDAGPDQSLARMILASPIVDKIAYWGASLIAMVILSLALASRRPAHGRDTFGDR